jgi:hypothetical protein
MIIVASSPPMAPVELDTTRGASFFSTMEALLWLVLGPDWGSDEFDLESSLLRLKADIISAGSNLVLPVRVVFNDIEVVVVVVVEDEF